MNAYMRVYTNTYVCIDKSSIHLMYAESGVCILSSCRVVKIGFSVLYSVERVDCWVSRGGWFLVLKHNRGLRTRGPWHGLSLLTPPNPA